MKALLLILPLLVARRAVAAGPPALVPDAACPALPAIKKPLHFAPGETLDYDIDALGAKAATLHLRVLSAREGVLPIEAKAQTNTFFAKVRRVNGTATSYLDSATALPRRYTEESTENEIHRTADVHFNPSERSAQLSYVLGSAPAASRAFHFAHEGLDDIGALYLLRQLPLTKGQAFCTDVYGIRRMWRLTGKVEGREHVALPIGEFEAWHISGEAVRTDDPKQRRAIHVWISDDARRLPLVAVGAIDLGAVRATLTAFSTNKGSSKSRAKTDLTW